MPAFVKTMWWQFEKDFLRELRAPRTVPAMLLLGCILACFTIMQIVVPAEHWRGVVGGLYWVTVFFAGSVALERSFANEHENGCWQALTLYPVAAANIFLAKLIANFIAVNCLALILAAAFAVFSNTPLLAQPLPFAVVVILGNLGYCAAGTVVSGLTNKVSQRNVLLPLLVLPLLAPVIIAAAESTRLLIALRFDDQWWRWIHLLVAFDVLFVVAGMLVFEFVIEE